MTAGKIAASTLWQLGSQAVTMLLGILSVKFVTAALSQPLVGNYQTVYGYLQIFGILADFGLYAVAVRELSDARRGTGERYMTTFSSLFVLRVCITLLSLGAAVIIAWMLPAFSGTPLPSGITIAVFVPFFTLLAGVFRMVFQVEYRMRYVFMAEVMGKAVPVLLFGFALIFGTRQSNSIILYHSFIAFGAFGSVILLFLSTYFALFSGKLAVCLGLSRITTGFATPLRASRFGGRAGLPKFAMGLPRGEKTYDHGLSKAKCEINGRSVCQWFANGLPRFTKGLPRVYQGVCQWFSWNEFRRLMRLSAPFGLVFLFMTLYRQSDIALIAILRPQDYDLQNAYYGVVLRIVEIGFLLPTFILNSVLPVLPTISGGERQGGERQGTPEKPAATVPLDSARDKLQPSRTAAIFESLLRLLRFSDVPQGSQGKSREETGRFLGKILLLILSLGSVVSLFSFFWARPLVLLLTREEYLSTAIQPGSDTALRLLSFSIFLSMIASYCFYLLLHKNRWKLLLLITFFGAASSLAGNLLLIPALGFIGANITSILVHLFLAFALTVISLRSMEVSLGFAQFAKWIAFSVVLGVLLSISAPFLQNDAVTLLAGVAGIAVAGALLSLFGLVPVPVFRINAKMPGDS